MTIRRFPSPCSGQALLVLLGLALAPWMQAQPLSLYEGSKRTFPADQGWILTRTPQAGHQTREVLVDQGFNFNSQRNPAEQIVYSLHKEGEDSHPLADAPLDRSKGFLLDFSLHLIAEFHQAEGSSGFRLAAISQDLMGVALGFHTGSVFAYGPDQAPAERADDLDLAAGYSQMKLLIERDAYTLLRDEQPLLSGPLRDLSGGSPFHGIPGMVYFGDADPSASASASIGHVRLATDLGEEVPIAPPAEGQEAIFALVEEESRLAISAVYSDLYQAGAQGDGSLVASWSGELHALIGENTIRFLPSSRIKAGNSGSWEPKEGAGKGRDPANYGGVLNIPIVGRAVVALRSLELALLDGSPGQPLADGEPGLSFPLSMLSLGVPEGSPSILEAATSGLLPISVSTSLEGLVSSPPEDSLGRLATEDGVQRLELPLRVEFLSRVISDGDLSIVLDGVLTAQREVSGPTAPLPVLGVRKGGEGLILFWDAAAGTSYLLERSEDLLQWETVVIVTPQAAEAESPLDPAMPHSFYRILLAP